MSARYSIYLTDSFGNRFGAVDDLVDVDGAGLSYTRAVNTVTELTLTLPKQYNYLFKDESKYKDARIEVWRRIGNGPERLETDTVWFLRKIRKVVDDNGVRSITVTAKSGNELLKRAVVAFASKSTKARMTGKIDTLMYNVVEQNLGATAPAGRTRAPYFTVVASPAVGTTTTKEFSYENVLDVLGDLAQESQTTTVPLFYDVIYDPGSKTFQFQIFAGQRGANRTVISPLTLSLDNGLRSLEIEYDYTQEVNDVYCGGAGEDSNRVVVEVSDGSTVGQSPINRREFFLSYNDTGDVAVLNSVAYAALQKNKAKKNYIAEIDGQFYGDRYFWGDKLFIDLDSEIVAARIDAISVSFQNGEERIGGQIRVTT